MTRQAVVAGSFYEHEASLLRASIEKCFVSKLGPGRLPHIAGERSGKLRGLVCPHAGYVYSGSAAAWAYSMLAEDGLPDVAVILGPNHYGWGAGVAITQEDAWATPLGTLQADAEVSGRIIKHSKYAEADDIAHSREHSIEVQLPFLQYIGGDKTRIVPIALANYSKTDSLALVDDLGGAIAEAVSNTSAVIIASTDFTHYESRAAAQAKDAKAIEAILRLDPQGLINIVHDEAITMCGALGTAIMLEACKRLGATSARKLTYYTSGDVSGDMESVVGYGAIACFA